MRCLPTASASRSALGMCWVTNPRGRLEERMDMNFRSLRVEPATRKNFAPYGVLVGVDPAVDSRTGEFYGDKVELWAPGGFVSDEQTRLSVARIHARRSEEHTSELQSL